jgi:hypothetical protein
MNRGEAPKVERAVQLFAPAWVAFPCLMLAGCGYNQSGSDRNTPESGYRWNSLYREDVQTVAVAVIGNMSFRRGVEVRLTEAVVKELEARAPYKVVPRERADTVLEGQITNVEVNTLYRDFRTSLPREQQMTITLDLVWKDLRNGRILAQRTGLERSGIFYPTIGESEFVGSQEAIERFAEEIVQELQADW